MNKVYFLLIFLSIFSYSQVYKDYELRENKIKEVAISAKQFEGGSLLKEVKSTDFINQYGKSTLFVRYNGDGSVNSQSKKYYTDNGLTTIDTIKENNNIKFIQIYKEKPKDKSLSHFQIKLPNDTVVSQTWYRNRLGKDSILVNKINNKIYVAGKDFYDERGELIKYESYSENGKILFTDHYKYKVEGKCKIYFEDNGTKKEKYAWIKARR